jgi:hypothetical protein
MAKEYFTIDRRKILGGIAAVTTLPVSAQSVPTLEATQLEIIEGIVALYEIGMEAGMNAWVLGMALGQGCLSHRREEILRKLRSGESAKNLLMSETAIGGPL